VLTIQINLWHVEYNIFVYLYNLTPHTFAYGLSSDINGNGL